MVENGVLLLGSGIYSYCLPFSWKLFRKHARISFIYWKPDNVLPGQGILYKDISYVGFCFFGPCCYINLKTDSDFYETLISLPQGPGTFIFKRSNETFELRMTMQHKDAPAYSTEATRISSILPFSTETILDWCKGSGIQNSICNSAFTQSRLQVSCNNCWAQAAVAILEFTAARYSRLILRLDWSLSVEDFSIRFQSANRHACDSYNSHSAINKAFAFGVFMIDADPSYRSDDAYSNEDKHNMYSLPSVEHFSLLGFKTRFPKFKGYPKIQTDYSNAKRMFFRGYCTFVLEPHYETENGHVAQELVLDIERKIAEYGPAIVGLDASYISNWDYTKQTEFETDPNLVYGTSILERSSCKSNLANMNHDAVLVGYGVTPDGTHYWIIRHTHSVRWFRILRDATNMCGVLNHVTFVAPCNKPAIGPDARLDSSIGTGIWVGNSIKDRTVKRANISPFVRIHENNLFEGVIGGAGALY